jgi:rubrerythrin
MNKGNRLRPNMYSETKFEINLGESLVVPENAVLFTGERKLVYVKVDDGKFTPREIETGYKSGNKYQILSGLKEGEEIAATGAYLIDSESQLKSGISTIHQHNDEVTTEKKEGDHSAHLKNANDIIHKRDVKVAALDKNNDGFVYQCPMDWEVISDEPGICPICKMDLEKFSVKEAQKNLIEYP